MVLNAFFVYLPSMDWFSRWFERFPASNFVLFCGLLLIFSLPFLIVSGLNAERVAVFAYLFLFLGVLMRLVELKAGWFNRFFTGIWIFLVGFFSFFSGVWSVFKSELDAWWKWGFVFVLLFMLLVEYAVPLGFVSSVGSVPDVYQWLANQTGLFTVAEYPMIPEVYFYPFNVSDPYYVFYSQFTGKRLFNGATGGVGKFVEQDVQNLSSPETPSILAWYNVSYVIVHYPVNSYAVYSGLHLVKVFPDASVYSVTASPSLVWGSELAQLKESLSANQSNIVS